MKNKLEHFKQPFSNTDLVKKWVFDANNNFTFEFITEDENTKTAIINALNAEDHKGIFNNNESVFSYLRVRTLGNLVGRHKLSWEDAEKLQKKLENWIEEKLLK